MDPGDISEQVALRKRLNCKPFKWFMKEVAFDLVRHYPPVEPKDFVSGEIRNQVGIWRYLEAEQPSHDKETN